MVHHILILCTGNVCRSPMAEVLFKARFPQPGFSVESAGLEALIGAPAHPHAVELMAKQGLNLRAHCARQATGKMLARASLILTMDRPQQQTVALTWPGVRTRVQLLGRWSGKNVADPYGLGRRDFESALTAIESGLAGWQHWFKSGNAPKPMFFTRFGSFKTG